MSVKGGQLPWHFPSSQNAWAITQLILADTQRLLVSYSSVPGPHQATWNDLDVRKCYLNLLYSDNMKKKMQSLLLGGFCGPEVCEWQLNLNIIA